MTLEKYTNYQGLGLKWIQPRYVDDPTSPDLHPGLWYGIGGGKVMAHAYDDQMQFWLDEKLIEVMK